MSGLVLSHADSDAIEIARHITQIQALGQTLVKSGLLPQGVKTPEAAVAIILKGRELGIPPMQALSHIHVISGKPTLSAELMLAMVMRAGHEVWVVETTAKRCEIAGKRRGSTREQSLAFTIGDAQQAGVLSNPTWKKYPDAMLRARAISAFCRMFAPDVLMGASYTPEELGAEVDGDGNVVTVERVERPALETQPEPAEEPQEQPQEEQGILGVDTKTIAASLKPLKLDPTQARDLIAGIVNRDVASIKDLTRAEGAELAQWSTERFESELDLQRSGGELFA